MKCKDCSCYVHGVVDIVDERSFPISFCVLDANAKDLNAESECRHNYTSKQIENKLNAMAEQMKPED